MISDKRKYIILLLTVFCGGMIMTSCVSQKRGFDYKKHYHKTKSKPKKIKDLTRYNCRRQ
jgi:hypothetical protein